MLSFVLPSAKRLANLQSAFSSDLQSLASCMPHEDLRAFLKQGGISSQTYGVLRNKYRIPFSPLISDEHIVRTLARYAPAIAKFQKLLVQLGKTEDRFESTPENIATLICAFWPDDQRHLLKKQEMQNLILSASRSAWDNENADSAKTCEKIDATKSLSELMDLAIVEMTRSPSPEMRKFADAARTRLVAFSGSARAPK
jgi:hypothetical protein